MVSLQLTTEPIQQFLQSIGPQSRKNQQLSPVYGLLVLERIADSGHEPVCASLGDLSVPAQQVSQSSRKTTQMLLEVRLQDARSGVVAPQTGASMSKSRIFL